MSQIPETFTKERTPVTLWSFGAILLLVCSYFGFYFGLHPHYDAHANARTYQLSIQAALLANEPITFNAVQGDTVTFVIRSDRSGEVHLHIYEKSVVLKPGGEVSLKIEAKDSGRFPLHLHAPDGTMRHLAMLEVWPR